MRILIPGGGGSIGSELVRQLAPSHQVYILDNNETAAFDLSEELKQKGYWVECRIGDIRNRETVKDVFSDFKPQYIFHAAALKHVTPAEKDSSEYVDTNVIGTLNLVDFAKRWECVEKFIFISTDKVVNAKSVMGQTKRLAETIVINKGYTAVRFGNVLASRGSVLEIWKRQVQNGEPITITDPTMKRYFMTIPQACELVIEAAEGEAGKIYILDMGRPKSIRELAEEYHPNYPIKFIGVRPGESMDEKLMTLEEESRAIKQGKFYVL